MEFNQDMEVEYNDNLKYYVAGFGTTMLLFCVATMIAACCQHRHYRQRTITITETSTRPAADLPNDAEQPPPQPSTSGRVYSIASTSTSPSSGGDNIDYTLRYSEK